MAIYVLLSSILVPPLLNWIIYWIESLEFILNWIIVWIEFSETNMNQILNWINYRQNSNIELNQKGYRSGLTRLDSTIQPKVLELELNCLPSPNAVLVQVWTCQCRDTQRPGGRYKSFLIQTRTDQHTVVKICEWN